MTSRAALLAIAACSACWTGPVAPPPPPPPPPAPPRIDLDVKMERTPCFGRCPEYSIELHGDGTVVWHGINNVIPRGTTVGRTSMAQLRDVDRALRAARFFDLDESGHLTGHTGGCADTPHAIITVRRGGITHRVDDAHCDPQSPLGPLEDAIDRAAGRGH